VVVVQVTQQALDRRRPWALFLEMRERVAGSLAQQAFGVLGCSRRRAETRQYGICRVSEAARNE